MNTKPIENIVSRPIETQRGNSLSRGLFGNTKNTHSVVVNVILIFLAFFISVVFSVFINPLLLARFIECVVLLVLPISVIPFTLVVLVSLTFIRAMLPTIYRPTKTASMQGINRADRIERGLSQLIAELKINAYFAFFLVPVTFLSLIIPHSDNFCFRILGGLTIAIIFYTFYLIIDSVAIGLKILKGFKLLNKL